MRTLFYRGADVILVLFDPNYPGSLEKLRIKFIPEIQAHCPGVPFVIASSRVVPVTDPSTPVNQNWSGANGAPFGRFFRFGQHGGEKVDSVGRGEGSAAAEFLGAAFFIQFQNDPMFWDAVRSLIPVTAHMYSKSYQQFLLQPQQQQPTLSASSSSSSSAFSSLSLPVSSLIGSIPSSISGKNSVLQKSELDPRTLQFFGTSIDNRFIDTLNPPPPPPPVVEPPQTTMLGAFQCLVGSSDFADVIVSFPHEPPGSEVPAHSLFLRRCTALHSLLDHLSKSSSSSSSSYSIVVPDPLKKVFDDASIVIAGGAQRILRLTPVSSLASAVFRCVFLWVYGCNPVLPKEYSSSLYVVAEAFQLLDLRQYFRDADDRTAMLTENYTAVNAHLTEQLQSLTDNAAADDHDHRVASICDPAEDASETQKKMWFAHSAILATCSPVMRASLVRQQEQQLQKLTVSLPPTALEHVDLSVAVPALLRFFYSGEIPELSSLLESAEDDRSILPDHRLLEDPAVGEAAVVAIENVGDSNQTKQKDDGDGGKSKKDAAPLQVSHPSFSKGSVFDEKYEFAWYMLEVASFFALPQLEQWACSVLSRVVNTSTSIAVLDRADQLHAIQLRRVAAVHCGLDLLTLEDSPEFLALPPSLIDFAKVHRYSTPLSILATHKAILAKLQSGGKPT